jgi:hypothetical protein
MDRGIKGWVSAAEIRQFLISSRTLLGQIDFEGAFVVEGGYILS